MTRKFLTKIVSFGILTKIVSFGIPYTENYRYRLRDDNIIYRTPIYAGKLMQDLEEPGYIYDFDYNQWRPYK